MMYNIKDVANIIGAKSTYLHECFIDELIIDSRTLSFPESTLFFAIKTSSNDGHKYIAELYKLRVRNFVISEYHPDYDVMINANFLQVNDVVAALQNLATHHRKQFEYPVIAITGSNGKTVVKEMLYQLLHTEFNIVRSPRSYNSQIGVPLSVWQMSETNTLGIFEAGISKPNEIEALRKVISPTIGIITNIGEAHQENFASMLDKCVEKLSLFNDSDVIIHNADDQLITTALERACLSHKGLGWSKIDSDAPLHIINIHKKENSTTLECVALGLELVMEVPFTDDGFIEDIFHCLALILYLKPSASKNITAFSVLEPIVMRLEVKDGINNCKIINDSYNSDYNSLSIALDFLQSRKTKENQKSVVILSDILQSGMVPKSLYKRVAELFHQKQVDHIIGIGPDLKTYGDSSFNIEKEFYETTSEFLKSPTIRNFKSQLILIKGSRAFHFEEIAEVLEKKVHETVLEVNLDAIIHNFNYFRSNLEPNTKIICMVKASGYGIGSNELAKTLQDHRCDYLAVAVADEGEELRKEGISIPIMVMNPEFSSFSKLFENNLEPEVYSFKLLETLIRETERRGIVAYPIHIKIDTGMHRLGFQPDEMAFIAKRLLTQSGLVVRSVFSHLVGSDSATFDDFTEEQTEKLKKASDELEQNLGYPFRRHILNSAGIERFTKYQMDMVRLGISLYGISSKNDANILPVCSLKSTILQIQNVPEGDSVGYGRKWIANRESKIAIVPIGYADGIDRHLGNGCGEVLIRDQRCLLVGNICMDICMVDVTDLTDVKEGDIVTFFDEHLTISEIANKLGTIPYEILTSISPRVKRIYYRE